MKDFYGYRMGVAFAREMLESVRENISVAPVIENLQKAMGNKPPAMAAGIKSVIDLLEDYRDVRAMGEKV